MRDQSVAEGRGGDQIKAWVSEQADRDGDFIKGRGQTSKDWWCTPNRRQKSNNKTRGGRVGWWGVGRLEKESAMLLERE